MSSVMCPRPTPPWLLTMATLVRSWSESIFSRTPGISSHSPGRLGHGCPGTVHLRKVPSASKMMSFGWPSNIVRILQRLRNKSVAHMRRQVIVPSTSVPVSRRNGADKVPCLVVRLPVVETCADAPAQNQRAGRGSIRPGGFRRGHDVLPGHVGTSVVDSRIFVAM